MVEPRPIFPEELVGWKAIASYLRVSVRTAQVFEKLRGLPVHRGGGVKAPVSALKAELEAWRQNGHGPIRTYTNELDIWKPNTPLSSTAQETKSAAPTISTQPMPEKVAISRRQVLLPVLAGSGILAGVLYGAARLGMFRNHPVDWQVAGNTLAILGDHGRELWHHRFPAQMDLGSYKRIPGFNCCVFTDLDGDGSWETIFIYHPTDPVADRQKVICFNANGKIRWEFFTSDKIVDAQGREWTPPYAPANFIVISPRTGPRHVVVTSVHYWSFPNQVAVLDATGKLVGEFWHRGHLRHLGVADLNGEGTPHVLLGGVNDALEYKQATLLVFDPVAVSGASYSPTGQPYFHGFPPGTQRAEVFFPRTPVGRDQEFNRVIQLMVAADRITASVTEGISEENPNSVVYEFDFRLNLLGVFLSDTIKTRYHGLEAIGRIPRGTIEGEGERLKREVRIFRQPA